jgi:thioredoxin-like negative regulator of GroEL
MIEVTDEQELVNIVNASTKVVALFHTTWCPFCRNFLAIFNEQAKKRKTTFIKVNVDDEENPLWETHELEAVPSAVFFENGKVKKRLDCVLGRGLSQEQFTDWLKPLNLP